jgi:peptide/nickel transport system substrate-binding protein
MSRSHKPPVLAVSALLVSVVLAACSGVPQSSASGSAAASGGDAKNGGTLNFQLLRDADAGYDPALGIESTVYTINDSMFDTLLEVQPDGKLVGSLATDWSVSDDELTYTFKIRTGVKFHNGREMTADDVKYTIDRMKDPATKSPRRSVYALVDSVEAPDATTVVVKLSEPYAPLPAVLADISAGIVPKEAAADLANHPVGTGPFKFVEWVRDDHLTVEANRDYWREGLPHLDGINYTFNADANARAASLRSGTVDFLWNAPPELHDVLSKDSSLAIYGGKGTQSFQYMLLNMQKEPFSDVRVRQAIYWALDREEIQQISRPGTTTSVTTGFLPPEHWAGSQETMYQQDYDKAKQLLAEAGHPDGFPMEILALVGSDFHIRSAQAVQQQLKPLGIEVTVTTVDSGQQTARRNAGDYDAIISGFSGTIDPDERFTQTFTTGGGTNFANFSDPEVDKLVAEARKVSDREKRAELYRKASARISEVGPMAFTYNYHFYDALQSYVKGYTFNPQLVDYRAVREIWLDK